MRGRPPATPGGLPPDIRRPRGVIPPISPFRDSLLQILQGVRDFGDPVGDVDVLELPAAVNIT